MKTLLIFDFDKTIIDDNGDTWILQCTPEKKLLQNSYEKGFGAKFMCRIFKYLEDAGVREDEVKKAGTSIPFTLGFVELLNFIRKNIKKEG